MCVIAAWEGRLPVMTPEIQPLPTLSAWKQECSLCHHSGKFVIWPLGMTLMMRNKAKIPIDFERLPTTIRMVYYSYSCWEWCNLEITPSLSQPAVILNIMNPVHNHTDYRKPEKVSEKPSLNWALEVNKNFVNTLLHLNWVFLSALACDCVKNWTELPWQCLPIFCSYSSKSTAGVGDAVWAVGALSPSARLGESPHDPSCITLLTCLLSSLLPLSGKLHSKNKDILLGQ